MQILYIVYLLGFCLPLLINVIVNKLYMGEEYERGESANVAVSRVMNMIMLVT